MKELEVNKPILLLRILLIVQILWVSVYILATSSGLQRNMSFMRSVFPLVVILIGLWKFKHWAWILAMFIYFCSVVGGLIYILGHFCSVSILTGKWGGYFADSMQNFQENPIASACNLAIYPAICITILILLIAERDYFD